ncbi:MULTISPECIES: protein-L-isoaspartate O-methyltransferase [unclassified Chelatococcus]|uniref:protein-L-isoaspartate O-methyltransferase family protein n=1 Tax=unclassified Chelatococcus TaxID=2638111 RepID=UPI001BCAD0B4|nr:MULTISPECIES: protein-L-isoaspartate O-methyltransferase [unclassified Chelatococcus]CAH1671125.1 L-isoaspartyl protein carboxyl methyltransferase [Hyphomicrobiales bacterium]MBS7738422.1 protein-L-isoaspartate O-methyltransferase [Chelatococcus sp. HY11]MBX3542826.1 protein-L-isoaspartate O-methyltransferase [Chelatococcus sp.]MCO5077048.1 protein-L-isoaspartate O-methyltransferase [Chelatococcus sp.]CAH1676658.1 L-isoaspartyl protein carboxyl methyltransferase [Hyphomicrobiales bacterium]
MNDFARLRRTMVDNQVRTYDVTSRGLLAVLEDAPRELFLPEGQEDLAYSDQNLVFGDAAGGRYCMLAPMILARLIQALDIAPGARVLDVGSGFGYSALIMSRLGAEVVAVAGGQELAEEARRRLEACQASGIDVVIGDVASGHVARAPYDAILVNGAFEVLPDALKEQLSDGGQLAGIDGASGAGKAVVYRRSGVSFGRRALFEASAPILPGFAKAAAFDF